MTTQEPLSPVTTDLCDAHPEVSVPEPGLVSFGARRAFGGPIATVRVHEDNALVRAALEQPGQGRVLVVDGGGSRRSALLGDRLAALAVESGWAGVVVHGCVRDSAVIARIDLGVLALCTHPRKSGKQGVGERDVPVTFLGVTFRPGEHLYADADGIVLSAAPLL